MMKRFIIISMLFVYLVSACGVFVTYHYCCGKFNSLELFSIANDLKKTCDKKEKAGKCCESHSQFLKVKDNALKSSSEFGFKITVLQSEVIDLLHIEPSFSAINRRVESNKAPPELDVKLYIILQTFRI